MLARDVVACSGRRARCSLSLLPACALLALSPPCLHTASLPATPAQWVGKAAETTSSTVSTVSDTVQSVTSTSIRKVVNDIKTLANVGAAWVAALQRGLGWRQCASAGPLSSGGGGGC